MAVLNWGDLTKSQEDDETIEEAIARLIVAHNDNEESHLATGQSLQSHKAAEIIDHLVGSVLADKISDKELMVFTGFDSLDGWSVVGSVGLEGFSFVEVRETQGETDLSRLYTQFLADTNFFNTTQDAQIQSVFYINAPEFEKFYFYFGQYISDSEIYGFGFKIIDEVVKGFFAWNTDINLTADLEIDPSAFHIYKAQYVAETEQVLFYIDGVLKATLEAPTGWSSIAEPYLEYRADYNEAGADYYVRVYNLYFSKEI